MTVDAHVANGVVVVRLSGELDHHVVEQIRDAIDEQLAMNRYRGLVIALSGVDFMDSSGLGLILGRYRTMKQHGGTMALCEVKSNLQKILELSGVLKIIPVYSSEPEAVLGVKEG